MLDCSKHEGTSDDGVVVCVDSCVRRKNTTMTASGSVSAYCPIFLRGFILFELSITAKVQRTKDRKQFPSYSDGAQYLLLNFVEHVDAYTECTDFVMGLGIRPAYSIFMYATASFPN